MSDTNLQKTAQLTALMGLYKHHLDLFWKWITLYVSIITAISAYLFNTNISPETKRLFPDLIAGASLGIALGCMILWRWLKELQEEVANLTGELNSPRYPSFLGMKMTLAAFIVTLFFAVFNLVYAAFGDFNF
jgi:disulfide bond formation protein DsbB